MCGIVGYVGTRGAEPILVEGLSRLEYRGYDSAGIATLEGSAQKTNITRSVGKLVNLRDRLREAPCPGQMGIGHTRWATHGRPSENNAHPHHSDGITVVHNGIIENHVELRQRLMQEGRVFRSDTDTEIFAHLIALELPRSETLLHAMRRALQHVRGAFALAAIDEKQPALICFAKQASPLVVGVGNDENFIASDVPAVLSHTRNFIFLEDGDFGELRAEGVRLFDESGNEVVRPARSVDWSPVMAEKGGHKHFMHKEIYEQPRAITDTLRGRLGFDEKSVLLDIDFDLVRKAKRIAIIACGTSWHAGMVGRYLIEKLARIPTTVELASEFRYANPVLDEDTLVLAISQSGETADTLAALKSAAEVGAIRLAICNVIGSAIARACESSAGTLYTRAGPEIGVASTKAFVTQLAALHLLAIAFAQAQGHMNGEEACEEMEALSQLPLAIEKLLEQEPAIRKIAKRYIHCRDMLYLGRGMFFPIALEGALKLKEISYIHAEGYAAGEMKHGPIALIDEDMPVMVIAPPGPTYEKVVANLEEVRARGGRIISVCHENDETLPDLSESVMTLPDAHPHTLPILATVPLQLFSYHVADLRGTDVDQPRNLAKSVTVE